MRPRRGRGEKLLVGDLGKRFGGQYELEAYSDADTALAARRRHADDETPVAAVFSADSAACGGDAFRVEVHDLHPAARRVVMVGRGLWSQAHPAVASSVSPLRWASEASRSNWPTSGCGN